MINLTSAEKLHQTQGRTRHLRPSLRQPLPPRTRLHPLPMLRPDPAQEPRLLAIIVNLNDRLREAHDRGWLGKVDGLTVSLNAANQKLTQMRKVRTHQPVIQLEPPRPGAPRGARPR